MKLFKLSTLALALALTGWGACSSSSNNNTDVQNIGGAGGMGGAGGAAGIGGAGGMGGAVADASVPDAPVSTGTPDAGIDAPVSDVAMVDAPMPTSDAASGEAGTAIDICTNLTAAQCHAAIINAPVVDTTVSALDPGANPPILYPTCSAQ